MSQDIITPFDERDRQRRRELEEQEQRLPDLVHEDLRKEIPALLTDIHQESLRNKGGAVSPVTRTLARFASLLGALYVRADIQTRRVVRLTWALVGLTVALLGLTAYLCYDAYLNAERAKQERKDQTEKRESDVDMHRFMSPL
jgi:hypothetical protein